MSSAQPEVVERYYDHAATGRARALKLLREIGQRMALIAGLAALVAPLQMIAAVTLDLPLSIFDSLRGPGGMAPSAFLSRGEGLFMLNTLGFILMARVWGAKTVSRVVLVSWIIAAALLLMLIVELAPELRGSDFPEGRFIAALLVAWMVGQWAATWVYHFLRGGAWWKGPFFGAAIGFAVQAAIYFPSAYAGTGAPWTLWLALQLLISFAMAGAFALFYGPLRMLFPPQTGLGGR
ncbi:MAG: hypothetical protein AAF830_11865 [Pseudomonadota bacterium]